MIKNHIIGERIFEQTHPWSRVWGGGGDLEKSIKTTDVRPDGSGSIGIDVEWAGGRKLDLRQL